MNPRNPLSTTGRTCVKTLLILGITVNDLYLSARAVSGDHCPYSANHTMLGTRRNFIGICLYVAFFISPKTGGGG